MFKNRTLFIVGAGASKEANLPVGSQLKDIISKKLDIEIPAYQEKIRGDRNIYNAIHSYLGNGGVQRIDLESYISACLHIRTAMPQAMSIDNFLDAHQGNEKIELCGKLAIVCSILEAERTSLLYFDEHDSLEKLHFGKIKNTWYNRFAQLLTENCHKDNIDQIFKNISFIVFNYDRCIEHFLFFSLQNYYGIDQKDAAKIMENLPIYHPYGVVGRLPWQDLIDCVPFGSNADDKKLLSLVEQIKTFTERVEDTPSILKIRQAVQFSETIVFLGFAFHPQNMRLIGPTEESTARQIVATAFGISKADCEIVNKQIFELIRRPRLGTQIHLANESTCVKLFDEHWRRLSLS